MSYVIASDKIRNSMYFSSLLNTIYIMSVGSPLED